MESQDFEMRPQGKFDAQLYDELLVYPMSIMQTRYCDGVDEPCQHPMPLFHTFTVDPDMDATFILN